MPSNAALLARKPTSAFAAVTSTRFWSVVDGQKINDPNTAHFNSNIPITPSEIERIEIIHGPASAEYGPDATGGVINIITKTFSKTAQPDNTSADGKIMLGQYKLINSSGGFFYKKDKLSISEGALLSKSDGNPQSSGTKGWFDINSYSLSGKYDISNSWSASYRYAHDVRDFNSRWYYSDSPLDSSREKVTRDMHQFQVIRKNENSSTVISGSNISTNDIFNFNPAYPLSINNTTFSNLQATHQFEALGNSKILFGAVLNQRSIESNNRGNHDLMHYGLFSTLSEKISESLTINGGIRAEYEKIYNLQFIPQLSIAYRLNNNCIFRASAGRSIRAADFTENYYNNYVPGIVAPGNRIGNPDLKPENSWNAELGADYNFLPGFYLSATGFGR